MKNNKYSWTSNDVDVKNIPNYGKGIFSNKKIGRNSVIAILGGYAMTVSEEEKLESEFNDYAIQISEKFVLGIKKRSEIDDACFFNHSCKPNLGINGQIFLVTLRNIKKDEQLTFDYAMCLHAVKGAKKFKMACLCGEKYCRKSITEDDWKIPELQKKYDGYFQWFIQEKIDKKKKKTS